MPYLEGAV